MDAQVPSQPTLPAAAAGGEGFFSYIAYCWRHALDFHGRAPRRQFWWFALFFFLVGIALNELTQLPFYFGRFFVEISEEGGKPEVNSFRDLFALIEALPTWSLVATVTLCIIDTLILCVLLVPSTAVAVRRLHDTGASGFAAFAYFGLCFLNNILGVVVSVYFLTSEKPWIWLDRVLTGSFSGDSVVLQGELVFVGWYLICSAIFFVLSLYMLIRLLLPGHAGENRYGSPPAV